MGREMKQKEPFSAKSVVMFSLGLLMLFPFIMMVVISFRASGDAYKLSKKPYHGLSYPDKD